MKVRNAIFLCLSLGISGSVIAQTDQKLKARELFYTPLPEAKPPAATKPSATKTEQTTKPQPKAAPESKATSQVAHQQEKPKAEAPSGYVQRVSDSLPPLALRYSLLKLSADGDYVEVDPDTTFQSGDKIKVAVESNDAAYLYIVQQGSSKAWTVLFPNNETDSGSNRIEKTRRYTLPAGGRFTFDEQPGTERLFIVLSRRAEPDLENMIYDLSKKNPDSSTPTKMALAQNRIEDSFVNRFRSQMISRDLVFEKVSDEKPAAAKKAEKAMYYATPDRSATARIVVDMNLRHR